MPPLPAPLLVPPAGPKAGAPVTDHDPAATAAALQPEVEPLLRASSSVCVDVEPAPPADPALAEREKAHRRELQGLALNALSTVFGTGMSLFAKVAGSKGVGVFEIVFIRALMLVLITGPDLLWHRINPYQDRRRRWLLVLRGVLGFCSVSSLFMAVALLPLADASVFSFLSPIFVAALSPFILKEKSSTGTLLGIPVAMVGVVLVAKPSFIFGGGGGIRELGVLVGLMQAFFNAMARMAVRALSINSSERMSSIIFGQGAISCTASAIICATTKQFKIPTEAPAVIALLMGGVLGLLYQFALTAGLQRARAAPAVAMSYLSVIWGIMADVLVFHNAPDALTLVGAAIICCSSFLVAFTQKKKASQTATKRKSTIQQQQGQGQSLHQEEDGLHQALLPQGPGSGASSPKAGRGGSVYGEDGGWSDSELEDGGVEMKKEMAGSVENGSARESPTAASMLNSLPRQLAVRPLATASSRVHSIHGSANSLPGIGIQGGSGSNPDSSNAS